MKKFFNLTAIIAMLSMMMCAVSITSCSDDDDDPKEVKRSETFTVTMGGATSLMGSFLSISKGVVFTTSDLTENAAYVEFVLKDGAIVPASEASNTAVNGNTGNKITVKGDNSYTFETATYTGTIDVEQNSDGDYSVTINRLAK